MLRPPFIARAVQTLARLAERPADLSSADAEPDCVLLTQHDAVFTLGTGSTLDHLRFDPDEAPFGEVVRTERGGEVTYHGPGQVKMRVCVCVCVCVCSRAVLSVHEVWSVGTVCALVVCASRVVLRSVPFAVAVGGVTKYSIKLIPEPFVPFDNTTTPGTCPLFPLPASTRLSRKARLPPPLTRPGSPPFSKPPAPHLCGAPNAKHSKHNTDRHVPDHEPAEVQAGHPLVPSRSRRDGHQDPRQAGSQRGEGRRPDWGLGGGAQGRGKGMGTLG